MSQPWCTLAARKPVWLPEQLCRALSSWSQRRSASDRPMSASIWRTRSVWKSRPSCEALMMASCSGPHPKRSTVPSASQACAWNGLPEERQKVTMPGSPQRSTISPSGPASAATARCTLSTVSPRRAWTMISGCCFTVMLAAVYIEPAAAAPRRLVARACRDVAARVGRRSTVECRHAVPHVRQARLQALGPRLRRHAPARARRRRRQAGFQADRLPGRDGDAPSRHRRRCELRRHRLDVPREHQRDLAGGGAQGRLPREGQAGHQDAGVGGQEAGRLRPHPGHPARAPAGGPHRFLPVALPRRRSLEVRCRTRPAGLGREGAGRRPHRPLRLQLPWHPRGVRGDPRRHRPVGVLPDPVQLHGRGLPGRPPRPRAGRSRRPRRDRHGASTRRHAGAQPAAAGRGPVGRGAGEAHSGRVGSAVGVEQSRGVVPAQRHERDAPRGGEPRVRGALAAGPAERRGACAGRAGARPLSRAQPDPVYGLSLLHALPAGRQHPRHPRALQRCAHVRRPGAPAPLLHLARRRGARRQLYRLLGVRGQVPAGHRRQWLDGEGAGVSGRLRPGEPPLDARDSPGVCSHDGVRPPAWGGCVNPRILFVEDSADDLELMLKRLREAGIEPQWDRVQTEAALREALAGERWELALVDYNLPGFGGLQALHVLAEAAPDVPAITVSGAITEETAVATMTAGAVDYVLKDNLTRLAPAVQRAMESAELRRRHRRSAEVARLALVAVDHASMSIMTVAADGIIIYVNDFACDEFGALREDMVGAKLWDYDQYASAATWPEIWKALKRTRVMEFEVDRVRSDGRRRIFDVAANYLEGAECLISYGRDITDRRLAEEQARESAALYRRIVELGAEGIWATDGEYRTTLVNPQMARMLGYEVDEMIGRVITDFMLDEDLADHAAKMETGVKGGTGRYERGFKRKDGGEVLVQHEVGDHAADHLVDLVAEHARHLRVDERRAVLAVCDPDALGGELDDAPVQRRALARLFLGQPPIGDVTAVADEALRAFQVVGRDVEDPATPVAPDTVDLELHDAGPLQSLPDLGPRRRGSILVVVPELGADHVLAEGAELVAGKIVHVDDDAVGGDGHDRHRGVVDGDEREAGDLRRAPVPTAQLGALHGALHGRCKTSEVVLEDVVHGAGGHGRHGRLFSDGAGDRDGGHVRGRLGKHVQGLQAAETGQVVVDQGELPALAGKSLAQRGFGLHTVPLRFDAGLAQALEHELEVVGAVFDEQDARVHAASPGRWTDSVVRAYARGVSGVERWLPRPQPARNACAFSIQPLTAMPCGHLSSHSPQAVQLPARSSSSSQV